MKELYDIIMALIEHTEWFALMFIVYKVTKNNPSKFWMSLKDKLYVMSER